MTQILFSVVSWEERCVPAFINAVSTRSIRHAVCFVDRRYEERSAANINQLQKSAVEHGVELSFRKFDFDDPIVSYNNVREAVSHVLIRKFEKISFDISTSPRNIIWTTLAALQHHFSEVDIYYLTAKNYSDWQTREDREPRMILNRSGIMYPDKPTCVLIMTGWEFTRAEKLFYKFEPRKAIVLRDIHASSFGEIQPLDLAYKSVTTEIAFDNKDISDENLSRLIDIVSPLTDDYNIICCSFGPKLGAVLLYRLVTTFDSIGLVYVPAGEHNPSISTGIGPSIDYKLSFACLIDRCISRH